MVADVTRETRLFKGCRDVGNSRRPRCKLLHMTVVAVPIAFSSSAISEQRLEHFLISAHWQRCYDPRNRGVIL
jgi:hypothetical protein